MRALLLSLVLLMPLAAAAGEWRFHAEADKGAMTAAAGEPAALDSYLFVASRYSPDPVTKGASIHRSWVRGLGSFRAHRIVEVHLEISGDYYTDCFMLLCETAPGRYLPIYLQQYSRSVKTPELTSFAIADGRCSITVVVRYSGTGAQQTQDDIVVTEDGSKKLRLRCDRKT